MARKDWLTAAVLATFGYELLFAARPGTGGICPFWVECGEEHLSVLPWRWRAHMRAAHSERLARRGS